VRLLELLIVGVMRIMTVSRETLAPFLQVATQHLVGILAEISKNPSNPRFNHYLFETLAALIRYAPHGGVDIVSLAPRPLRIWHY
jgi:exportin-2 (importin alpha re-exporter)